MVAKGGCCGEGPPPPPPLQKPSRGKEANAALGELDDSSVWDMWSPRLGLSSSADALMFDASESARLGREPAQQPTTPLLRTSSAASGSTAWQASRPATGLSSRPATSQSRLSSRPATSQSRVSSRVSSRPSTSGSVSPRQVVQAMLTTGIPSHKASSPKPLAGHSYAFTTIHDPKLQRKHAWGDEADLKAAVDSYEPEELEDLPPPPSGSLVMKEDLHALRNAEAATKAAAKVTGGWGVLSGFCRKKSPPPPPQVSDQLPTAHDQAVSETLAEAKAHQREMRLHAVIHAPEVTADGPFFHAPSPPILTPSPTHAPPSAPRSNSRRWATATTRPTCSCSATRWIAFWPTRKRCNNSYFAPLRSNTKLSPCVFYSPSPAAPPTVA